MVRAGPEAMADATNKKKVQGQIKNPWRKAKGLANITPYRPPKEPW